MSLTNKEMLEISEYCKKNTQYFYDIEQELYDHMVNYVEDTMDESTSFAIALANMKEHFKTSDIESIIKSKKRLIRNRLFRKTINEFTHFFTVPKIGITILLVMLFIWLDQKSDKEKVVQGLIHLLNLVNISYAFGRGRQANQNIREKKKATLSMSTLYNIHIVMILPTIGYLLLSVGFLSELTISSLITQIAFYGCPLILLINLAWQRTYIETQLIIRKQYPGAFVTSS